MRSQGRAKKKGNWLRLKTVSMEIKLNIENIWNIMILLSFLYKHNFYDIYLIIKIFLGKSKKNKKQYIGENSKNLRQKYARIHTYIHTRKFSIKNNYFQVKSISLQGLFVN